ncbi:MAG TPA: hypothetical protein VIC03_05550 [Gemmatimonadaceae bacterium]
MRGYLILAQDALGGINAQSSVGANIVAASAVHFLQRVATVTFHEAERPS